ncbi:MAG: HAD family hydrolase [Rhodospirillaceae bacterium]|nr:MAG: HAD family hydrolase [Rhodospirillaceae bacterium]
MGDVTSIVAPAPVPPDSDIATAARTLARPRAIIFDWDNTLVDTWPCIGRATNITLETMGLPTWTDSEIRARVAGSLRDTFPRIYGARWEEAREVYYRAFKTVHLEMLAALPGAEALLNTAAQAGLYMGVVSNKVGGYLRSEAAHLGWDRYFGRLVGAEDAVRDKPAPDPIWLALSDSAIPAGPQVWFVGDTAVDVDCGRAAGCTTILVHRETTDPIPHYRTADCETLAQLIGAALANPTS